MAGEVHLAVLADDASVRARQDGAVVVLRRAVLAGELGVAEIEGDAEVRRRLEQRPGLRARHLALEEGVDLGLVLHPVAREEGGQRQLGKDHELGAARVRLAHHGDEPPDDALPAVSPLHGAHLRGGDFQLTGHGGSS